MFKIHTKDGKTTPIDLSSQRTKDEWEKRFKDQAFQDSITGVTVVKRCGGKIRRNPHGKTAAGACEICGEIKDTARCNTGVQFSMSRPVDMDGVFYRLELVEAEGPINGGEKIICQAGDVALTLMSHANQPACRVVLAKTGKRRYNPFVS